ncbi:MAG: small subunit ribosomal protein S13 [Parcubacteria group bacterium Gr01-1014_18]|nr:MAG: small subunit ribosomal protein S13 [Parcubacteria group bacterium Greene0416_36]TSC80132.1 MAG: small subunit ribosomal protein S13 [Parcubacteria group bacterium Gr01-1014_18]TSC99346.1 MAG: small subunit ribosomal protein S13 [Parcubacteria group bacterium Greene1014_20]TSD06817.1 MAG: small subunit ribosomal protein S13 [Parcubacteria group bacterium Greene0714_2]
MVRIAGVNLPNKRIQIALSYIYGVGKPKATEILAATKIDINKRPDQLTEPEINLIRDEVKKLKVEGDLRREILLNVRRLREIGTYRGTRHAKHLPVRGQTTKRNSRTVRGNVRKTAGSGRKDSNLKT